MELQRPKTFVQFLESERERGEGMERRRFVMERRRFVNAAGKGEAHGLAVNSVSHQPYGPPMTKVSFDTRPYGTDFGSHYFVCLAWRSCCSRERERERERGRGRVGEREGEREREREFLCVCVFFFFFFFF